MIKEEIRGGKPEDIVRQAIDDHRELKKANKKPVDYSVSHREYGDEDYINVERDPVV